MKRCGSASAHGLWLFGIRWVVVVSIALCSSGCDVIKFILGPPPIPPKHPTHDLVIEGGVAKFNGTPIAPDVPMSKWIELFGKPDREQPAWLVWDSLGLKAGPPERVGAKTDPLVKCLTVTVKPYREGSPKQAFPGRILMGGAALYNGVPLAFVDQQWDTDCVGIGGTSFSERPLGNYACETKNPPRYYSLTVEARDWSLYVIELEVCRTE